MIRDEFEIPIPETQVSLGRRLVAEALGTGLLIVAVIGSGIMATNLSQTTSGSSCPRTPPQLRGRRPG